MRFGALHALVVIGASLVTASPIRVVVTDVSATGVRYGHAAANALPAPPTELIDGTIVSHPLAHIQLLPLHHDTNPTGGRKGCLGMSMRNKALDASNFLRQLLGLEPIMTESNRSSVVTSDVQDGTREGNDGNKEEMYHVLPFIGTPVRPAFTAVDEQHPRSGVAHLRPHHRLRGSFLHRVHYALMSLGPWEGRAVAFVLGCGIGVLLRMAWVMVLLAARAFRTSHEEETEYDVVFDEAETLVPPPQYTVFQGVNAVPVAVDEKADKNPVA